MKQLKDIFKNPKAYIVLLLILTSIFFYIRSINRNLIGDEIMYFYVCEEDFNTNYEIREIKTFSDILESQINHYNRVNGGSIVHAIEHFFSGIASVEIFYFFNTLVFIFTVFLFVKITFKRLDRYIYWIFTIVVFLYFFPEHTNLWTSINYSLNYLWPICFTLSVLYFWNKIINDTINSKVLLILMPIVGLVAGWSHEIFSVSLSAVSFIYYCYNYKKFSYKVALIFIPLWIGSAFLVFAPGNFLRIQNGTLDSEFWAYLKSNPLAIKMLPIMVGLIIYMSKKHLINLKQFVSNNSILIGLFVVSLLFVLGLGTVPNRSYVAVELYSLILIINLIKTANVNYTKFLKFIKPICVALTLVFVVHQSAICYATIEENGYQDKFITQYVESEDGIAIYDYKDYGAFINPYIRHFELEIGDNPGFKFHKETLELYYSHRKKRLVPITSVDYELISNFSEYIKDNKTKFSGPFYSIDGCNYAWAYADSVDDNDIFQYCYNPVSFSDEAPLHVKFKRWLIPESYSLNESVNEINEVIYNSRRFLAIRITPMRSVVDIKPECSK